jgi:hypothetical protein
VFSRNAMLAQSVVVAFLLVGLLNFFFLKDRNVKNVSFFSGTHTKKTCRISSYPKNISCSSKGQFFSVLLSRLKMTQTSYLPISKDDATFRTFFNPKLPASTGVSVTRYVLEVRQKCSTITNYILIMSKEQAFT